MTPLLSTAKFQMPETEAQKEEALFRQMVRDARPPRFRRLREWLTKKGRDPARPLKPLSQI